MHLIEGTRFLCFRKYSCVYFGLSYKGTYHTVALARFLCGCGTEALLRESSLRCFIWHNCKALLAQREMQLTVLCMMKQSQCSACAL